MQEHRIKSYPKTAIESALLATLSAFQGDVAAAFLPALVVTGRVVLDGPPEEGSAGEASDGAVVDVLRRGLQADLAFFGGRNQRVRFPGLLRVFPGLLLGRVELPALRDGLVGPGREELVEHHLVGGVAAAAAAGVRGCHRKITDIWKSGQNSFNSRAKFFGVDDVFERQETVRERRPSERGRREGGSLNGKKREKERAVR